MTGPLWTLANFFNAAVQVYHFRYSLRPMVPKGRKLTVFWFLRLMQKAFPQADIDAFLGQQDMEKMN